MIVRPWAFRATVRFVAATHNFSLATICRDARGRNTWRVGLSRLVGCMPGGLAQLITVEAAVAAHRIRLTCLLVGIPMASGGTVWLGEATARLYALVGYPLAITKTP